MPNSKHKRTISELIKSIQDESFFAQDYIIEPSELNYIITSGPNAGQSLAFWLAKSTKGCELLAQDNYRLLAALSDKCLNSIVSSTDEGDRGASVAFYLAKNAPNLLKYAKDNSYKRIVERITTQTLNHVIKSGEHIDQSVALHLVEQDWLLDNNKHNTISGHTDASDLLARISNKNFCRVISEGPYQGCSILALMFNNYGRAIVGMFNEKAGLQSEVINSTMGKYRNISLAYIIAKHSKANQDLAYYEENSFFDHYFQDAYEYTLSEYFDVDTFNATLSGQPDNLAYWRGDSSHPQGSSLAYMAVQEAFARLNNGQEVDLGFMQNITEETMDTVEEQLKDPLWFDYLIQNDIETLASITAKNWGFFCDNMPRIIEEADAIRERIIELQHNINVIQGYGMPQYHVHKYNVEFIEHKEQLAVKQNSIKACFLAVLNAFHQIGNFELLGEILDSMLTGYPEQTLEALYGQEIDVDILFAYLEMLILNSLNADNFKFAEELLLHYRTRLMATENLTADQSLLRTKQLYTYLHNFKTANPETEISYDSGDDMENPITVEDKRVKRLRIG